MRLHLLVSLAVAILFDINPTASALRVNGWYRCGFSTTTKQSNDATKPFECAEVEVPLCHESVCESDRTISLFVKRLRANPTEEAETRKSLWLLPGGPGGSSRHVESAMVTIHRQLKQKASLYTVDHRGTGRSFFLQCDAAQSFTSGSPGGVNLGLDELPDCLRDILFQIDNQTAAISVTSAAKDLALLTDNLHDEDEEVYVYGASYGSYLTERLMHLAPSNVKGYILDGVVAEDTAASAFTARNSDNVIPTKRLAQLCKDTKECAAMFGPFKTGELYAKWQKMYHELDARKLHENPCADFFRTPTVGDKAARVSSTIKFKLGPFANSLGGRAVLPALLHLIHRCRDKRDLQVIQELDNIVRMKFGTVSTTMQQSEGDGGMVAVAVAGDDDNADSPVMDVVTQSSLLLHYAIKASELWPSPSPSWADEMEVYKHAVFPQAMISDYAFVCMFKGNLSDPSCDDMDTYDARLRHIKPQKFLYETDKYHQKFATIPDHASVLVINGKLDFQTMSDNGVREFENL